MMMSEKLDKPRNSLTEKRKATEDNEPIKDLKKVFNILEVVSSFVMF